MGHGPLAGVRVVELTSMAPAPFGCMVLADLGAEVVVVDRLHHNDGFSVPSGYFDRGQQSIALNLRDPAGVQLVKDLVADADAFIEGQRPGVAEWLGIGPDDLLAVNPRLIYGRLTGFGQDGPLAGAAGHDINCVAIAGALEPLGRAGDRPYPPANLLADFAGGGFLLVIGILAALHERQTSGRGQVVDAAMVDGAALLTTFLHAMHGSGLWTENRGTNWFDGAAAFYDTYECSDGRFVAVGALEPKFYAGLLDGLGLADAELPDPFDLAQANVLRQVFADVFATRTRDEWAATFADIDACVTPVLSPWEAHRHPQNAARRSFIEVNGRRQPAPAPRFSRTPPATPRPAPLTGADTEAVLHRLGYDGARIARLREAGVVS